MHAALLRHRDHWLLLAHQRPPKKQELTEDLKGLAAWSVCFSTYIVIISKEHPEKFQELLAYHATIMIEALCFGCKGWLAYERMMFRERIEKEPSSSWSMLHPMFYRGVQKSKTTVRHAI